MVQKSLCLFVLVITLPLHYLEAQQVEPHLHELENGLRILIVERPGDPSVAAGWVTHVGSVNERPGITGIAHLFEHMMFKGTQVIGTRDFEEDRRILAAKDSIKALMRAEETTMRAKLRRGEIEDLQDPEAWSASYRDWENQFSDLIEAQREVIVKDEFARLYTGAGATGLNAGTGYDLTLYYVTVPSNKVELFFWLESDRLLNPVFREFYAERDVVREERRMRIESTPTGRFEETFEAMFYTSHPYGWPIIGWPSDVENITREQADEFFDLYYAPNNITFVLVGDVNPDEIIELAERYLGRLPASDRQPPEVITEEIPQQAEKRMIAHAETNPMVEIRYHTVPFWHRDEAALQVLGGILSGRTGRLHRDLVLEKDIALEAGAAQRQRKYAGFFEFSGVAKDGHTPEEVEQEIYCHIDEIKSELVDERELQRVKNQSIANSYRRLSGNFWLMYQLLIYEGMGGWDYINEQPDLIQSVTAEDIQRVANQYFDDPRRNVAIYYTRENDQTPDPLLTELPLDLQAQARQVQSQIQQTSDVEQLRGTLEQVRANAGQVTDDNERKLLDFMARVIEQRLEQIENE